MVPCCTALVRVCTAALDRLLQHDKRARKRYTRQVLEGGILEL